MCYKKPGPRCSNHAKKVLDRAKVKYHVDPTISNLRALNNAQLDYDSTKEGRDNITDLIDAADSEDEKNSLRVRLQVVTEYYENKLVEHYTAYPKAKNIPFVEPHDVNHDVLTDEQFTEIKTNIYESKQTWKNSQLDSEAQENILKQNQHQFSNQIITNPKILVKQHEKVRDAHRAEREAWQQYELNRALGKDINIVEGGGYHSRYTKEAGQHYAQTKTYRVNFNDPNLNNELKWETVEQLATWNQISIKEAQNLIKNYDGDNLDHHIVSLFQQGGPHTWKKNLIFVDIETTGLDPNVGEIIEIGLIKTSPSGEILETIEQRFDLHNKTFRDIVGLGASHIHQIYPHHVADKPTFNNPDWQQKLGDHLNNPNNIIIAHNDRFEHAWFSEHLDGFWETHNPRSGTNIIKHRDGQIAAQSLDTRMISAFLYHDSPWNTLESFATTNGVEYENAHAALPDAIMTFKALVRFNEKFRQCELGERPLTDENWGKR